MVGDRRPRVRVATPDSLAVRVYSWVVTAVFVSASVIGWRRSAVTTMENVDELIAFTLAAMAADFLRVRLWREMSFSVSLPVLLAAGMILPPWQAAAVAFLGSMDVQEIRRGVPFSRMVFNRSEIGLSVMAASAGFHALVGDSVSWPSVLVPSLVALAIDAAVNAALVAWPVAKLHAVSTSDVVRRMFGPRYGESLLRYVGVGLMAPLIAAVWLTAGAYGLAAFLSLSAWPGRPTSKPNGYAGRPYKSRRRTRASCWHWRRSPLKGETSVSSWRASCTIQCFLRCSKSSLWGR